MPKFDRPSACPLYPTAELRWGRSNDQEISHLQQRRRAGRTRPQVHAIVWATLFARVVPLPAAMVILCGRNSGSRIVPHGGRAVGAARLTVRIVASLTLFASAIAHGQQAAPGPVYAPAPGPGTGPVVVPAPARVIEQDLVVTDPTVAAPRRWLVGGAIEGWFSGTPWEPLFDVNGNLAGPGTPPNSAKASVAARFGLMPCAKGPHRHRSTCSLRPSNSSRTARASDALLP
jgi:hypothetical protein